MDSLRRVAYSAWARFLQNKSCKFLQLPEEIIVDGIFQWLSVYDIITLRFVCKDLSMMTKKPAVWKRLLPHLSQIEQPLAPLPPSKAYSMRNLTAHDMEIVVSRALSYDAAWKKAIVRPYSKFGGLAFHKITDMTLLPGGHFLVTAVTTGHTEAGMMHGLIVWALQHPASGKPAPLFFRYTEHQAYSLTAKYMTVNGQKGITVAFLRKKNKDADDKRLVPQVFELGGKMDEEDPYQPLKYECTVVHVTMSVLDQLTDRHVPPMTPEFDQRIKDVCKDLAGGDLWNVVSRIRTGTQLGIVTLDVINGEAYVCALKRPNSIVFQRINDSKRSILHCNYVPEHPRARHVIYNFRVIPNQNEVLIVRNIEREPESAMKFSYTTLELYPLPIHEDKVKMHPPDYKILDEVEFLNVQISEVSRNIPAQEDESITPYLSQDHIRPISIYFRTALAMYHFAIYPYLVEPPPTPPESPMSEGGNRQARTPRKQYIYGLRRYVHTSFTPDLKKVRRTEDDEIDDDQVSVTEWADDDSVTFSQRKAEDLGEWKFPVEPKKDDAIRFLPGSSRAILYEIPLKYGSVDPPVTGICAYEVNRSDYNFFDYVSPMTLEGAMAFAKRHGVYDDYWSGETTTPPADEEDAEDYENVEEEQEVVQALLYSSSWRTMRGERHVHPSLDIPLREVAIRNTMVPMDLTAKFAKTMKYGVHSMCFDEDTGRLVIATKKDRKLHVFDFASGRSKDNEDKIINGEVEAAMDFEMELAD